jgi:hypothetical protein
MNFTEITTEDELREAIDGYATGRAVTKAFLRSQLWEPSTWRPEALPTTAALCRAVLKAPETLEELEAHYAPEHYSTTWPIRTSGSSR